MDYKPFKDEATWIRFKERFTTIESHGLGHILTNTLLTISISIRSNVDGSTRSSKIQAPQGKSIVTKHIDDKDTRKIWEELSEYYTTRCPPTFNPVRSQRT
jgi:hypothetical protein